MRLTSTSTPIASAFVGASSLERLGVEASLLEFTRKFKGIPVPAARSFLKAPVQRKPEGHSVAWNALVKPFVTAAEKVDFISPWTLEEWLCRNDIVPNQELLMVRANMEPGRCHPFHTHPTREEIIYILSGRAEQWLGHEHRILRPGRNGLNPQRRSSRDLQSIS